MTGTSAHLDKAAEEALRDSEGRYRSLLGISPDATAIHIEGKIVLVNAAGAKLLGGVTPEDVIGKLVWEFVHPDFQGIVKARLQQDSEAFVEEKLIRLDGQVIDVQMAVASVMYEGRRARQVIIRDITWRKQAEEAQRAARSRYQALVETISQGIEEIDTSGVVKFANAAHHRQYEYSEGELIGMSIFDIVPTESEADELRKYLEYLVKEQPSPSTYLGQKMTKSGKIIDVEVAWTYTRDAEERVTGFVSIITDISERTQAGEKLRESLDTFHGLFDATPDGIFVHEGGIILEVNRAGAAIYGYDPSEMIGTSVLEYADEESRDLVMRNIRSGAERPYEAPGTRKDGTKIAVEIRGKAFTYLGRPARLTIIRDVTERKRLEKALQIIREELEDRVDSQMNQGNHYNLSFRETAVLNLLASGRSDKEIATLLSIRTRTASKHVENILRKMGAACRTDAGVRAVRESLID